jgi:exonuclease SbcC
MKPVYLELCGVNSFSERVEIDFRKLLEFGIFGIFGDTGSGKSTILDCIVFALYGKVSRLDAREAVMSNLINYNSDRAFVNFEFEIEYEKKRRIFRVERELKRKNGTQNVRVYERSGETLSALAEGARDGNALLEKVIGLEQKDFEKCIALPQGEFAQFVKSQKSDRLKLVSRLFDLERYGEGLVKRTNARYQNAKSQADILKAKLEPYESVTEEAIKQLSAQIVLAEQAEKTAGEALVSARESEKRLSALAQQRREAEKTAREMEKLEAVRGEMAALNAELSRLEKASAVIFAARDLRSGQEKKLQAEQAARTAALKLEQAEKDYREASAWDSEKANLEITKLNALIADAKLREADRRVLRDAQQRLQEIQNELLQAQNAFQSFSYEAEKANIEARLKTIGNGDFLSYCEVRGKAELLREEYAVFAEELKDLTRKFSVISEATRPLIEKYVALSVGERKDYTALRREFEAAERDRADLRNQLVFLEKEKGRYEVHLAKIAQLEAEQKTLLKRIEEIAPRLKAETVSSEEAEANLERLYGEQKRNAKLRERASEELTASKAAHAAALERVSSLCERTAELQKRYAEALEAGGFESEKQAADLCAKYGDAEEARLRVERYKENYAAVRARFRALNAEDYSAASDEAVKFARQTLATAENEVKECAKKSALVREAKVRAERDIERKKAITKEYREKNRESELYERLKKLLDGNKFMEFVAEEYLQTVAQNASSRLLALTDGRYFLRYDGNFVVGDNFNGGAPRGVFTLSGGETFLVSLSLALALSAEICARSLRPIEFFFLDEGFGTLDEKLVDTVMDSLEKLKGEHFSIGIISHVEELRHRIERKLSVKKATESRGSQITME